MSRKKLAGFRSGQESPFSGQALLIGPNGEEGPERTITKGKPLPPSPKPGMTFKFVDLTNNAAGRKRPKKK